MGIQDDSRDQVVGEVEVVVERQGRRASVIKMSLLRGRGERSAASEASRGKG